MFNLFTTLSHVLLLGVLCIVTTTTASITDFYVLPDVAGQVYLLSKSTVNGKDEAKTQCQTHSSSLAFFDTNQEYRTVTSYLDTFLKSTNRTGLKKINGIWIDFHAILLSFQHFFWKMPGEAFSPSVWASGQPSSSCDNLITLDFCCGIIAVNGSLVTGGLHDKGCGEMFWYLCKVTDECAFNETNKCTQICRQKISGYTCSCDLGYSLASDNHTCVDIDECKSATTTSCQQACNNTNGSFTCGCHTGYKLNINGVTCDDINECTTGEHMCGDICNNSNGSYNCSCRPGYELGNDSRSCLDVNECNTSYHECEHVCNNLNGSYNCSCHPGYYLGNDSKSCFDGNECNNSKTCDQICNYVNGSFKCSCNEGFELGNDSKSCLDIDECNMPHPCQHYCNNVNGSYYCSCNQGFKLGNDSKSCFEMNECNCTNVNGSYNLSCICVNGSCNLWCNNLNGSYNLSGNNLNGSYNLSGNNLNGSYNLSGNNVNGSYNLSGNNLNGSYNLSCSSGFQLTNGGRDCVDLDECNTTTHNCSHICNNTYGSYKCTCKEGYQLSSDLVTCQKVNESGNGSVNPEQNRTISGPSATGNCSRGFVLDPKDNVTCLDIDECRENPCNHTCRNTLGSYKCSCRIGFTLDSDLVTCRFKGSYQFACPCQCTRRTLKTSSAPAVVVKESEEIRGRLKLYKSHLVSHRRSKGCADDSRISAKAVGYSGCLIAVVFVSVFLTSDVISAGRKVWEFFRNKICHGDCERE